jgi:hypothetical protein
MQLDKENGNNLWEEAIKTELKQINNYQTFCMIERLEEMPIGYKCIPYHIIFDVKFDLCRKARLVAGGHCTNPIKEDIYSGVVSMEAVRLGFILAKMNNLMVCAANIGNAFLYGKTREKVYVVAGPEFGPEMQGKRLVIDKSLYGLKSSAARFHEHLLVKLRKLKFQPSKADPDLWMKRVGTHYEYIARYVDDIIVFSCDPMAIMKEIKEHYILKGVGEPRYYLGGNVLQLGDKWEKEGISVALSAETYVNNVLPRLASMCKVEQFKKYSTPFSEEYHAKLDTTNLCSPEEISKYQSLVGSANWLIMLGQFDIAYAVNTLS